MPVCPHPRLCPSSSLSMPVLLLIIVRACRLSSSSCVPVHPSSSSSCMPVHLSPSPCVPVHQLSSSSSCVPVRLSFSSSRCVLPCPSRMCMLACLLVVVHHLHH